MLNGIATSDLYEDFLKKGLCQEHLKEFSKDINQEQSCELQRKALLFIRLHLLDPILLGKSFVLEDLKTLYLQSSYFEKYIAAHKAWNDDPSEEAKNAIMTFDSVIVYLVCFLSKICCIGGLFLKRSKDLTSQNAEFQFLDRLINSKNLMEKDVCQLSPIILNNFTDHSEEFLRVCYSSALFFVRSIAKQLSLVVMLKQFENELEKTSLEYEQLKLFGSNACREEHFEDAINAYTSALNFNRYSFDALSGRAQSYIKLERYVEAEMDGYVSVIINPYWCKGYCKLSSSLFHQTHYKRAYFVAKYGLQKCKASKYENYEALESIKTEAYIKCMDVKSKDISQDDMFSETNNSKFNPSKASTTVEDVPDLIEASDSETDMSEDAPDLLEASDTEESDLNEHLDSSGFKEKKPQIPVADELKKENTKEAKIYNEMEQGKEAKPLIPDLASSGSDKNCSKESKEARAKQIHSALKEASQAILDSCSDFAARLFRESLDEIKSSPELYGYKECDIVCIKYAYGIACCTSGGYDDLQKCIMIFKEILDEHNSIIFPAAYYGLGLTYRKLNRFKDALQYLKIVHDILEKGIHFKVYPWPGVSVSINETKPESLKVLINELIKVCESPPAPDAICRHEECSFQPSIYYTDPYFKGFTVLTCSEQCCLQYHQQCWKTLKISKSRTDKEFLEKSCFTPDCAGVFVKIQIIDKVGNIEKVFTSAEMKKPLKQKKHKLEKKLEAKEEKKKKRHDSKSEPVLSASEDFASNLCSLQSDVDAVTNKNNAAESDKLTDVLSAKVSVNTEPFYILKKDLTLNESSQKGTIKQRERKKHKERTLSVDEFCGSSDTFCTEYLKRVNQLRQNQEYALNNNLPWSGYSEDVKEFEETHKVPPIVSNLNPVANSFTNLSTDVCDSITKNIYSFLEDLLSLNGPLKLDDPILTEELKNFPSEANLIIADSGGLAEFLKKNIHFTVVKNTYVCVVADVVTAYKLYNNSSVCKDDDDFKILKNENISQNMYEQNAPSLSNKSCLNPEAAEYKPVLSQVKDVDFKKNLHFNDVAELNQETCADNESSQPLITMISNLRQPLLIDDDSANHNSSCNKSTSKSVNNESSFSLVKNIPDINSYSESHASGLPSTEKLPNADLEKWQNVIKTYFSDEMKQYHSIISAHLKPYAIVKLPEKHNKASQTEKLEMVSRETMKTDKEIPHLTELSRSLYKSRIKLLADNEQLQQKLESAMNSATKCQKKMSLELTNLKKDLEDTAVSFEEEKKVFRQKETKWENERKHLTESLNKAYEEIMEQKNQIDKLHASTENMKSTVKHFESKVSSLEGLKNAQDIKMHTLMESFNNLKKENVDLEKRARHSELQVLLLKKDGGLKRIDKKSAEAALKMKELKDGISLISGNLHPVFVKNIEALLSQIAAYIDKLAVIRLDFVVNIDEQIQEIKNGLSLSELKPLEMKDIPEIPCWSSQFPVPNVGNFYPHLGESQQLQMGPNFNQMLLNMQTQNAHLHMNPVGNNNLNYIDKNIPATQGASCNGTESVKSKLPSISRKIPPGIGAGESKTSVSSDSQTSFPPSSFSHIKKSNSKFLSVDDKDKERNFGSDKSLTNSRDSLVLPVPCVDGAKRENVAATPCLELGYGAKAENSEHMKSTSFASASLQPKIKCESKNSYEKLLAKLQLKYPSYSQVQLISFVKEFRSQREGKLSGLTMDNIINNVGALIESKKVSEKNLTEIRAKGSANKVLVNKKLVPDDKLKDDSTKIQQQRKCAWNVGNENAKHWSGDDTNDKNCIICLEDMSPETSYKVDCGHTFHLLCIREWLNKKSDCPVCRIHLLLPEDYPSLS